jgi:Zn-dependent protease with chaperone function
MDFFEAQARAKKRTSRLVVLFVFAVIGTILATYVAALFATSQVNDRRARRHAYRDDYAAFDAEGGNGFSVWQPRLFFAVAGGTLAVVAIGSLFKWSEFSAGGRAVAESVGGRRIDPATTVLPERRLLNVVEEMAIASGVPMPAVYVLDDEAAINAFAAGLTTSDAVVTVTRGTLDKLTRDELQGVIGHEFSHILNGDMRLNLRITAVIFGILVLGLAGRGILWSLRYQQVGRSRDSKNSGNIVIVLLIVGFALLIVGYIGYFFGRLIQAAVSREREFLADASSVQFTRNPSGITGALKKIGGYALGSSLATSKAGAIGHFFFAQSFRSNFGGLWATHPPLPERIRAIDPQFDGKFFEPPAVVDVAHESFREAGFAPRATATPPIPPSPVARSASAPTAISSAGTIPPEAMANAQILLDAIPAPLRDAARSVSDAPALVYLLLLDEANASVRDRQRELIASHAGADARQRVEQFEPLARQLSAAHRLPLLQLSLPALRQLPPESLTPFLDTLDELVHADGCVTPFEFALQKILTRSLALGRKPTDAVIQIYSFNAVTDAISVVLSALAHAASNVDLDARAAFSAGASQLKLIEAQLSFVAGDACAPAALDAAVEKLATASLPIKQRTLVAAAHVVGADGQILITEAELLRAIAAALDVPLPPLVS